MFLREKRRFQCQILERLVTMTQDSGQLRKTILKLKWLHQLIQIQLHELEPTSLVDEQNLHLNPPIYFGTSIQIWGDGGRVVGLIHASPGFESFHARFLPLTLSLYIFLSVKFSLIA